MVIAYDSRLLMDEISIPNPVVSGSGKHYFQTSACGMATAPALHHLLNAAMITTADGYRNKHDSVVSSVQRNHNRQHQLVKKGTKAGLLNHKCGTITCLSVGDCKEREKDKVQSLR